MLASIGVQILDKDMDTSKCPVCGKPGIPNYLNEDVVCPHCGSDLKIYRKVSELSNLQPSTDGSMKFKILSIVLPLIAISATAAICYSVSPEEKVEEAYYAKYLESEKQVAQLNDSVSVLNAQIQKLATQDEDYEDYVVKKNEGPWSVVNNIFGKRSDWEAIAKANGLWDESRNNWKKLHPGQVIRIKK